MAAFSIIFLKIQKEMEIYLLTRLDAIKEAFEIMFVIGSLIVVFSGVGALIACETPCILKPLKRILMVSITTAIIGGVGYTLTPSVKEAMIIYGYNTFNSYYQSNPTLQTIPDKFILYLDSVLTTGKKEEGEN